MPPLERAAERAASAAPRPALPPAAQTGVRAGRLEAGGPENVRAVGTPTPRAARKRTGQAPDVLGGSNDRRQFRHLCRLCSPNATLYTDMVHANLFVHGPAEVLLAKQPARDNCVLQLGGCDPATMRRAAEKAREMGWREINLNVGCPSDKVQRGFFGAVLMKDPELVARLCTAIADGLGDGGEVSVKCRIGIDDLDSYEFVHNFVSGSRFETGS
ncbi:MAG: dihydrouridine synthase-domain-containing protein [Olpidium bornovanus]|uniref:Dihydrouridine synthase-domain-containing protein n=1 Tax=Olpidium bornovanus TaxID=278681 RepID=A0A8H7ZU65_9FUNG|nr:MAG: dihydrouridine synthase-domain-containing protein [Olpidium bornovanus]